MFGVTAASVLADNLFELLCQGPTSGIRLFTAQSLSKHILAEFEKIQRSAHSPNDVVVICGAHLLSIRWPSLTIDPFHLSVFQTRLGGVESRKLQVVVCA